MSSVTRIATTVGRPHDVIPNPRITDERAIAGPTLTSISPAMITSVMPVAAMPTNAASRRSPSWLAG
jgi:hypothetical protein